MVVARHQHQLRQQFCHNRVERAERKVDHAAEQGKISWRAGLVDVTQYGMTSNCL